MHKKRSEICICCRVSEAKFYLYHSTKIANARPPLEMSSEYNSVTYTIDYKPPIISCVNLAAELPLVKLH